MDESLPKPLRLNDLAAKPANRHDKIAAVTASRLGTSLDANEYYPSADPVDRRPYCLAAHRRRAGAEADAAPKPPWTARS